MLFGSRIVATILYFEEERKKHKKGNKFRINFSALP